MNTGRDLICTPMKRSAAYCGPLSGCLAAQWPEGSLGG
jgi:hypothetical protein